MEADMVQKLPGRSNGKSIHRKVKVKVPGPMTGRKRTAASIKQQVATSRRNRAKALREGRPYGHTVPPGGGGSPALEARKLARAARGKRVADALVYLSHAQRKALGGISGPDAGRTALEIVGLLALAIAALEGRD